MTKYNINYGNKKEAVYRSLVNPKLMNELKGQIISILLKRKNIRIRNIRQKIS